MDIFASPGDVSVTKLKGAAAPKARPTFLREKSIAVTARAWGDQKLRRLVLRLTVSCRIGCVRKSPQINTPEKTANTATTAAETRIESTGTAITFWSSRQGAEFARAIFDADQTAEKKI